MIGTLDAHLAEIERLTAELERTRAEADRFAAAFNERGERLVVLQHLADAAVFWRENERRMPGTARMKLQEAISAYADTTDTIVRMQPLDGVSL